MENAVDALKIAFAVFTFVLAITITFSLISQAKSTADYVLYYSDKTNFYEYRESSDENRKVSTTEVISTLHRYDDETMGVTVKLRNGKTYTFDLNNEETNLLDTKLDSKKKREENLAKFIDEYLLNEAIVPKDTKFKEDFVEVPISGIYKRGEDDTEIVISSGGKKVYITYSQE